MDVEIIVPFLGESVSEATIVKWHKQLGHHVKIDELLLELETEKVTLEVHAPSSGIINKIFKNEGDIVSVGVVVGQIMVEDISIVQKNLSNNKIVGQQISDQKILAESHKIAHVTIPPSVQRLIIENRLNCTDIKASGRDGRITKGDVLEMLNTSSVQTIQGSAPIKIDEKLIQRVKMSPLRKTIALRLKDSQNKAAILTTVNEINMSRIISLRTQYREEFEKKHNVKLGFMSFFVKVTIEALKMIPSINAEIEGDDIIYKNYYDIGVAVSARQGLVVPIIREADKLSFADIEKEIVTLSQKARGEKLSMSDLSGGTFTISNGGVYGSLLSTPIINPPQSAILGLHKIEERPIAVNGIVLISSMMYVALSYDHRIIDGKEAVSFLVKVKELIENPERLLLNI